MSAKRSRARRAPSFTEVKRRAKQAYERYAAATDALLKHPQTIARKAAEEAREAEPEFAGVVDGILKSLRGAEDVAITVCGALQNSNSTESNAAAHTLMSGCANELTEQIGQLERAMENARIRGSRMVVAKEISTEASDVQS
jgi:hypothetical protein